MMSMKACTSKGRDNIKLLSAVGHTTKGVSELLYFAVIKHHGQKELGEEKVCFILHRRNLR